jgi:hypothetical protein
MLEVGTVWHFRSMPHTREGLGNRAFRRIGDGSALWVKVLGHYCGGAVRNECSAGSNPMSAAVPAELLWITVIFQSTARCRFARTQRKEQHNFANLGFVTSLAGMVIRQNEYRWCYLDDMIQKAIIRVTCVALEGQNHSQLPLFQVRGAAYSRFRTHRIRRRESFRKPLALQGQIELSGSSSPCGLLISSGFNVHLQMRRLSTWPSCLPRMATCGRYTPGRTTFRGRLRGICVWKWARRVRNWYALKPI